MTPIPDLTAEIEDIVFWTDTYGTSDQKIIMTRLLALIERVKRQAVEEAFRRLAELPSYGDFLQDQQKVLHDMFPPSPC